MLGSVTENLVLRRKGLVAGLTDFGNLGVGGYAYTCEVECAPTEEEKSVTCQFSSCRSASGMAVAASANMEMVTKRCILAIAWIKYEVTCVIWVMFVLCVVCCVLCVCELVGLFVMGYLQRDVCLYISQLTIK